MPSPSTLVKSGAQCQRCVFVLLLCLYFVIFWPNLCRVADVQLFPPVKDGSYIWILHENRIDTWIHGQWPCLRPVHLDTIQHHDHTSVQGSRSVQSHLKSKELFEHFPRKEWDKNYTFWLRSWSTPTSNLRAESDKIQVIYSIDWYLVFLTKCQIFKQLVPTWHSTSQHCYHDDLQAPLPREWPYS